MHNYTLILPTIVFERMRQAMVEVIYDLPNGDTSEAFKENGMLFIHLVMRS